MVVSHQDKAGTALALDWFFLALSHLRGHGDGSASQRVGLHSHPTVGWGTEPKPLLQEATDLVMQLVTSRKIFTWVRSKEIN